MPRLKDKTEALLKRYFRALANAGPKLSEEEVKLAKKALRDPKIRAQAKGLRDLWEHERPATAWESMILEGDPAESREEARISGYKVLSRLKLNLEFQKPRKIPRDEIREINFLMYWLDLPYQEALKRVLG